ncbi:MAG: hypothetical protein ACPGEG_06495 [Salibacteraceae bacterium]
MKDFITLSSLFLLSFVVFAQDFPEGHENHFKEPNTITSDLYSMEFSNILSENNFCKMKMTITNNSQDYLLIDLSSIQFSFDHGDFKSQGKLLIIEPLKSKSKTIEVNGDTRFHVDKFSIKIDYLASLPKTGTPITIDDFRLPPEKKEFTNGPMYCKASKAKMESRITTISFNCQYQGNEFLMVNPLSIKAKLDDGQTFPNKANAGGIGLLGGANVLQKGEKEKVSVEFRISTKITDMQFTTFWVEWNDTFIESSPKKLDGVELEFELDPDKTAAQNK